MLLECSPEFLFSNCSTITARPATVSAMHSAQQDSLPSSSLSSPRSQSPIRSVTSQRPSGPPSPGASSQASRIFARPIRPRIGATPLTAAPHRSLPKSPLNDYIRATTYSSFETGGVFFPSSFMSGSGSSADLPVPVLVRLTSSDKVGICSAWHQLLCMSYFSQGLLSRHVFLI